HLKRWVLRASKSPLMQPAARRKATQRPKQQPKQQPKPIPCRRRSRIKQSPRRRPSVPPIPAIPAIPAIPKPTAPATLAKTLEKRVVRAAAGRPRPQNADPVFGLVFF